MAYAKQARGMNAKELAGTSPSVTARHTIHLIPLLIGTFTRVAACKVRIPNGQTHIQVARILFCPVQSV